jgi:hypothetical protein
LNLIYRYCVKMNDQQIRSTAEALLTSSASNPQSAPQLRECMSDTYYTYILWFQILPLPLVCLIAIQSCLKENIVKSVQEKLHENDMAIFSSGLLLWLLVMLYHLNLV